MQQKSLRIFGEWLHDPNLWHLNRRSASGGATIGAFLAFVPLPLQMLFAAALAMLFRVNLPLAVAMVWITNPVTIPPLLYACFKFGKLLLGHPTMNGTLSEAMTRIHQSWDALTNQQISWTHFLADLTVVWEPVLKPLALGCLVAGVIAALLAYFVVNVAWRWHVVRKRQKRLRQMLRRRATEAR